MTNRTAVLDQASVLISGDRADTYGSAHDNFTRVGQLWGALLGIDPLPAETVALMLTQLKIARIIANPAHEDSWVDAAGYIALGAEVATQPF